LRRLFEAVLAAPSKASRTAAPPTIASASASIPLEVYFKENIPSEAEAGERLAFRERS
jgi:RecB family exonuclease